MVPSVGEWTWTEGQVGTSSWAKVKKTLYTLHIQDLDYGRAKQCHKKVQIGVIYRRRGFPSGLDITVLLKPPEKVRRRNLWLVNECV